MPGAGRASGVSMRNLRRSVAATRKYSAGVRAGRREPMILRSFMVKKVGDDLRFAKEQLPGLSCGRPAFPLVLQRLRKADLLPDQRVIAGVGIPRLCAQQRIELVLRLPDIEA